MLKGKSSNETYLTNPISEEFTDAVCENRRLLGMNNRTSVEHRIEYLQAFLSEGLVKNLDVWRVQKTLDNLRKQL